MKQKNKAKRRPLVGRPGQVDFIVAGAQKCGTTALRRFLGQHPQIGLERKRGETHFFDKHAEAAAQGQYDGYHARFRPGALNKCTGDVTPIYLYREGCLAAAHRYNPDMKVIVLLRDPSERAYSQWVMEAERGKDKRAFLPALLHEARYFRQHGQHPVFSYVQRGFYDVQIARLQAQFPARNCLILRHEDLRDAHQQTLARVFDFLGVRATEMPPPEVVHKRSYPAMPAYTRRLLVSVFAKDIIRLQVRLGWDCATWLRS